MRKHFWVNVVLGIVISLTFMTTYSFAQVSMKKLVEKIDSLKSNDQNLQHRIDVLEKTIDDIIWFQRVGTVAFIDKVYMTGPPLRKEENPTGLGAGNPVKFWAYVFIPKNINFNNKYPLIVFPHGGVHSNFSTYYTHIIKELIAQQYIVVAAEYRGSTG